ncbi:potassium channel subfamily K member 16-like isoform X2 [Hemibagrus wyckioides]|uniref:potassium channel subfamily K member 16-like isoform X2 n=1 Tax=Hemibagrus wyckioides TaxID=337641 RepID=UPI00266C508E|nr:potassium channel subfamily K member 16-like isoform X2 [Hemibagrus wyckioides]
MAQLQVTGARFSWTTLLALSQFTYLLLGATVFQLLEKEAESQNRNNFQLEKLYFLANYTCLDGAALEKFVKVILDARESGVNPSGNSTNPSNWDFGSSFFFAGTVVTTIGYGNLSPTTYPGQVFCVFYALCGIPLNLAFLNQLSKCLTAHLGRLEHRMMSMVPHKCVEVLAVALFLLMGSLLFLIFPPVIFSFVEGWSYGEGFYYTFITLSTIGFGDYVVGNGQDKQNVSVYRCLAAVWIIFALAWLALLLNIGARIMEHFLGLKQPPVTAKDEQSSSVRKQEEGLSTPENQPQEKQKEKGFFKIRMV